MPRLRFLSAVIVCALCETRCTTDAVTGTSGSGGASASGGASPTTTTSGTGNPTGAGAPASGTSSGMGGVATSGTGGGASGGVGGRASSGSGGSGGAIGTGTGGGATGGANVDAGPLPPGLGPAHFNPGDLDPPSNGATITFQNIGKAGWFPSRRDPATGPCDFSNTATCCQTKMNITSDKLTPWEEDLIMTLRGPLLVKQLVVYQPNPADAQEWRIASAWDDRSPTAPTHIGFDGNNTQTAGFHGAIGTECLVDMSTDGAFACGPGSLPYCAPGGAKKYYGWQGSKMIVLLSMMPYADTGKVAGPCSQNTTGGWYNAPWVGLSVGELVRSGKFGTCQCYSATNPNAGDGCGQFNVFETVNDNNTFRNFDVYSTNFFGYGGYVGEGPCGTACKANLFPPAADLINKSTSLESPSVVTGPGKPVGAAFRRPENGYRYFVMLLDVDTRTVQLAIVHPQKIPAGFGAFLPDLPARFPRSAVDAALAARLPR